MFEKERGEKTEEDLHSLYTTSLEIKVRLCRGLPLAPKLDDTCSHATQYYSADRDLDRFANLSLAPWYACMRFPKTMPTTRGNRPPTFVDPHSCTIPWQMLAFQP